MSFSQLEQLTSHFHDPSSMTGVLRSELTDLHRANARGRLTHPTRGLPRNRPVPALSRIALLAQGSWSCDSLS
jgi:hypothetical protein